jgi:DNA polymerase-3 subunit epsilon
MNFTAIDFETANEKRASACAIGMVKVKDGVIIDRHYSLLKPTPLYFTPFHSSFHGIKESDVLDAPTFEEYADFIKNYIGDDIIVAHNASFEKGVFSQSFLQINAVLPDWSFLCTYRAAKKYYDRLLFYSLPDVCRHLGIEFNNHHNALSDAEACAKVMLKINSEIGNDLKTIKSEIYSNGYTPNFNQITAQISGFDKNHPFYGKSIAITGTLLSVRKEIVQKIVNVGANYHDDLLKNTNYLIIGTLDSSQFRDGIKSNKIIKAEKYKALGLDIEIIDESQFWEIL